jgi:hypothetical protein
MTRDERIAILRAESRKLMHSAPSATPQRDEPVREVQVPDVDPVQEWREWHDTRDREREANRAKLRRADREHEAAYARQMQNSMDTEARLADLERRVSDIEATLAGLAEAVSAAAEFSSNSVQRFGDAEAGLRKLTTSLDTTRESLKSEIAGLRDRVASGETIRARAAIARAEEQNNERHERSQRDAAHEHATTRREISEVRNGLQLVVRDLAARKR